MSFARAISIGPEFFAKAKNDYRSWFWALAREFMQNGIDSPGCDHITVTVKDVGRDMAPWATELVVENNGTPMTQDILVGKLLALGGSGKNFQGTVGGMGKAKELLYLTHESYEIVTGNLVAAGRGAGYDLTVLSPDDPKCAIGTRSTVTITDKLADTIAVQFKRFITLSQWGGTFVLNGETITERLNKGRGRKNLDFGRVYTNKDHENLMVIRMDGMPMFTRNISYAGCVVLELNGKSNTVLQSSRDSLKWEFSNQLDEFATSLVVDKRSALIDNTPKLERTRFAGYQLKGAKKVTPYLESALKGQFTDVELKHKLALVSAGHQDVPGTTICIGGKSYEPDSPQGHVAAALINLIKVTGSEITVSTGASHTQTRHEIPLRPEFVLKNETGLKIPDWFTPVGFSAYSKGLIWRWMGILVTLADIYEATTPFSVGFIFTEEETLAQYEREDGEHTIYIRAADVVRHEGKAPVLKARWSLTAGEIWKLVSYAAHEFTHYHWSLSSHDEDFAARLTEVMGVCLRERSRLAKTFQTRVEWPDINGQ